MVSNNKLIVEEVKAQFVKIFDPIAEDLAQEVVDTLADADLVARILKQILTEYPHVSPAVIEEAQQVMRRFTV